MSASYRIGVVGSGFIARGFVMAMQHVKDLRVTRVLTRTDPRTRKDFPRPELLTNSIDDLIEHADIVVECSGDVVHASEVVDRVLQAGLPVVTMDAEFHVTTGSYFVDRGLLTEAEGDQPGCLAALRENILQMGFRPLVYGNIKRFLNHNPTPEEMHFWARKQGITLPQVTAFTDGTKVQIEQALVANGLGADIAVRGMLGIPSPDVEAGARMLADGARRLGHPISDYVLSPGAPAGVFIAAEHDEYQRDYLQYLKLGDGPYYVLLQPFHLCHLEIQKTIRRVLFEQRILLNNTAYPRISVAAVAKRRLAKGTRIERGIGSFEVRGEAIRILDEPDHVPIGLLANAVLTRDVDAGELIRFDDVELPDTLALHAWQTVLERVRLKKPAPEAQALASATGE